MSERPDLLTLPLDVQRSGLEGARRWARWNVEFQRRMVQGFSRSMRAQREAERETMDLLESLLELSAITARSSLPGTDDELSELYVELERSLVSWGELRDEARPVLDDAVREGARTYDGFARLYLDLMDAWVDAALALNADAAARVTRSPTPDAEPVEIAIEDDNP